MSAVESLAKALDKEIGLNAISQEVTRFIDTGYPPLNKIISGRYDGGLPFGRMMEMFGESSTGKTCLATQWMINAQRMGGIAIFVDWERSFDLSMAKQMGLNDERPYWIYVRPKTWEEGNLLATRACKAIRGSGAISNEAPILVVYDSIAAAIPKASSDKEIDELTMNDTSALARVTSTTLKVQAQFADEFNATFLYLNQTREKIGVMFGNKVSTPGGKAMEFYSTVRLTLSRQKVMEEKGKDKEMVGQNIKISCIKSKLTAPFKSCSLRLSFDEIGMASFDNVCSLVEYALERKIVSGGAWVEWNGQKFNGKKKLIEHLRENEGDYVKFIDDVIA